MALWFLRGIRRGIVTSRYPAGPDPSASDLPTPPAIDRRRLTPEIAARLAASCPSGAVHLGETDLVLDIGACTGCGRCARAAPDVVRPSGVWELAATGRDDLKKRIPIHGVRGG